MRARLAIVGIGLFLASSAAAPPARAQATQPAKTSPAAAASSAVDDPYKDVLLPTRRGGAATQATLSAGAASASNSDELDLKRLGLAMAIVLGAMYVTHRVWKRLGMPGSTNRPGALQVLSRLSLSPKQQLVLVRVGRRVVLVGNTGTQMTALCDIGDPDEAAGLIGQVVSERDESVSSSFHSVLGGEEKRFDDETNVDLPPHAHGEAEADEAAASSTRDELNDMMEKVRNLSRQFRPGTKGE